MQVRAAYQPPAYQPGYSEQPATFITGEAKSKIAAGLLGIFLGWLGIHRFYLGYTGIGVAQLVLGLLGFFTCGVTSLVSFIWGVIDGVMILNGSIAADAQGQPLKE
jgi:TM2 domain-containing membrane protein YozV